jgi:hypothetical protein
MVPKGKPEEDIDEEPDSTESGCKPKKKKTGKAVIYLIFTSCSQLLEPW